MYRFGVLIYCVVVFIYVFINIRKAFIKDTVREKIRKTINLQILFLIMLFASFVFIFLFDINTVNTRMRLTTASIAKTDHIEDVLKHLEEDIEMMAAGNAYKDLFDQSKDYTTRYMQVESRMESTITYHQDFAAIKVISKDGYILSSTLNDEGEYVGETDLLTQGLRSLTFGDPYYDEDLAKKILPVAHPISSSNSVEGILVVYQDFSSIDSILYCENCLGKESEAYLVDSNNYALTELKDLGNDDLYPLDAELYSEVKASVDEQEEKIFFVTSDYSGQKVALTASKLSNLDWYLIMQIDYQEVLKFVYLFVTIELALVTLLLLMSRIGSKRIAKSVSEPIESLTDEVQIVASGDFKKKVSTSTKDEVGILSKEIDNMASQIIKSRRDIDKKVEAQTKELALQREKLRRQQLALLNILEDESEDKRDMEEQRNKLDIILEGIGDGVFAMDKEGTITRFNKVASDISGFESRDVVGKNFKDVLIFRREKDDSLYYDFIEKALKEKKVQNMANHTYLEKKDGTHVAVADSAAPILDPDKKLLGCVVVFRDVTKENEINDMKDEFVSVASHQLRTPLTGIKWYLQLLLKKETGKLNSNQTNFIRSIYDSNERMIKLVDDLLSVSRIDTGKKFEVKKKKVNIVGSFKNVIKTQSVIARKRDVEIKCQKNCPNSIVIRADEDKLVEVFSNVISNAVKYSKTGGKVDVSVKNQKDAYVFAVKDYGLGIPKSVQGKIFEKFFRADNVKKHQVGGNGLGLYIAKSIMLAHGGDIWFESKVNKSTTFFIKVPK